MTLDMMWEEFTSAMANISLSQRATEIHTKNQFQLINELEKSRKEQKMDESFTSSKYYMSFIDPRNKKWIYYGSSELDANKQIELLILKKNREYQFLIMEAYEKFEDAIEYIYAFLGKNDINFWKLNEYGDINFSALQNLDLNYYKKQAEKRKNGTIKIAKDLIENKFKCDCIINGSVNLSLKHSIIFIEQLRHRIVHCSGFVPNKDEFFKNIADKCGIKLDNNLIAYMSFFFGSGKYENWISLTEHRVKNMPNFIDCKYSRFDELLNSMLLCVYILYLESKKYIDSL